MNMYKHARRMALGFSLAGFASGGLASIAVAAGAASLSFIPVEKMSAQTPPPGGIGWQKVFAVDVPTGRNLIYTDSCPDDAKVPLGNSFEPVAAAKSGLQLVASFRANSAPQQWQWEIRWPRGAPAGSRIYFNIYCTTQ